MRASYYRLHGQGPQYSNATVPAEGLWLLGPGMTAEIFVDFTARFRGKRSGPPPSFQFVLAVRLLLEQIDTGPDDAYLALKSQPFS